MISAERSPVSSRFRGSQRTKRVFLFFVLSVLVSCSSREPEKSEKKNDSTKQTESVKLEPKFLPKEEYLAGWISLFDGKSMVGWHQSENVNWKIEDDALSANGPERGLLMTTIPFSDYEFRCEYRLEKGGNSGVFLRTELSPKDPGKDCYELNMCDSHKSYPTGSIVARKVTDGKHAGEGVWKSWRVVAKGNRITAWLDDVRTVDFVDETKFLRKKGYIGLQKRTGKIEFRNLRLKPLGMNSLFDGSTLKGWKIVPGNKAKIVADNQTIHLAGAAGFLQSEKVWGDFLFQSQVKTETTDANSGIFFRAMPATQKQPSNGYELQIQNSFADGDRSKPNDYRSGYGTGAIFRRQKARWVVPNDKQWFTITLVADGNRFASWVNGYQVVDWADERKSDENPRKGKRLKAGHFILQCHDPQTDVRFRDIRIR